MRYYILEKFDDIPKYSQVECKSTNVKFAGNWCYCIVFKDKEYFIKEDLVFDEKTLRTEWREAMENSAHWNHVIFNTIKSPIEK